MERSGVAARAATNDIPPSYSASHPSGKYRQSKIQQKRQILSAVIALCIIGSLGVFAWFRAAQGNPLLAESLDERDSADVPIATAPVKVESPPGPTRPSLQQSAPKPVIAATLSPQHHPRVASQSIPRQPSVVPPSVRSPGAIMQKLSQKVETASGPVGTGSPLQAGQKPALLWQYNYNSGFNDKRTRWFPNFARTARGLHFTMVLPYFNSFTSGVVGSQIYNPFSTYFNTDTWEHYVHSVAMEDFHKTSGGHIDIVVTTPSRAQARYGVSKCGATSSTPAEVADKDRLRRVVFYKDSQLPFTVHTVYCSTGNSLAGLLPTLASGSTAPGLDRAAASIALDGYDNHGSMDDTFFPPRNIGGSVVAEHEDYLQWGVSFYGEAKRFLQFHGLVPVKGGTGESAALVPSVRVDWNGQLYWSLHWRWASGARANIRHNPEDVIKKFKEMVQRHRALIDQMNSQVLFLYIAGVMATEEELNAAIKGMNDVLRLEGTDKKLKLVAYKDFGYSAFQTHPGKSAIMDQVLCSLGQIFIGSGASTFSEVVVRVRKQMEIDGSHTALL